MIHWCSGNELELLENGEVYFPRLIEEIEAASREVVLETYIWADDEVGMQLADALARAASRGVHVAVTVDGFGTPKFPESALERLTAAGVSVCSFDMPSAWLPRTNVFCRLHRKIVVIDRRLALIGGINVWADHLRAAGTKSMQDYAVAVRGDVVHDIVSRVRQDPPARSRRSKRRLRRMRRRSVEPPTEQGQAAFVMRDNEAHRNDIEFMYRAGIRDAKHRIIIANAYFFPGYGLLRDLVRAARRGIDVTLILQGRPDVPLSTIVASILYEYLISAGVTIYHYCERAMHAKVAVIDAHWATVGSSNLDPISLSLNLEANLFVIDARFAATLRESLERLIDSECEKVTAEASRTGLLRRSLLPVVYYLARQIPIWQQRLFGRPRVKKVPTTISWGGPRHVDSRQR